MGLFGPKKKKVLITDDDPTVRALLQDIITEEGHHPLEADDGARGVEAAKRELPDLIFMDINMPLMSGLAAVRALRADPATRRIPIIMCSSQNTMNAVDECLNSGANDYIIKPFELERILAKMREILGKSS